MINELKRISLREFVLGTKKQGKIDREQGIINGVKILGISSRNNRRYPIETLQQAVSMYENAKVNLNHPNGDPTQPRQYQDRFGLVRNVRIVDGDGLFADFHFNPKHQYAEQLLWDAENAPENVGFSHNIEAEVVQEGETLVVKKIFVVRSVDIVADPATTQGLFEAIERQSNQTQLVEIARENELLKQRLLIAEQFSRRLITLLTKTQSPSSRLFSDAFVQSIFEGNDLVLLEKMLAERMALAESLMVTQTHSTPISREQSMTAVQTENTKTFVELIT